MSIFFVVPCHLIYYMRRCTRYNHDMRNILKTENILMYRSVPILSIINHPVPCKQILLGTRIIGCPGCIPKGN